MEQIRNFFMKRDVESEDLGGGVSRKILAYSDNLMAVEISFEKGAIGELHSHPHEQCTYILEGVFEFQVGNESRVVKAGDMTYKQPNIKHGVVCLEAGRLLDIFSPKREDFLE